MICDLAIIGGGPAGLAAAINAASEGLSVTIIDSAEELGGQARYSSLIENYPGFPHGTSGQNLLSDFISQADKFRTRILCPQQCVSLRVEDRFKFLLTDTNEEIAARSVLIATGLTYRRLAVEGLGRYMGHGVQYGPIVTNPRKLGKCHVAIVGGANSAGQAAMNLSSNPGCVVSIVIRKRLKDHMSTYLVERIRACANVQVIEGAEVKEVFGQKGELTGVNIVDAAGEHVIATDYLFIFIGVIPRTYWLKDCLALDPHGFILTGAKAGLADALAFETSIAGVFATGDIRSGSTKRVGAAVGEGISAVSNIHEYLANWA